MLNVNVSKRYNKVKEKDMYGANLKSNGQIGIDELVERISARCTVTKPDIVAVLAAFQEQAIFALRNAQGVSLGDLGWLYLRAKTETVPDGTKFTADNVKGLMVGYRARRAFTGRMQKTQKDITFKVVKVDDNNTTPAPPTA